MREPGTLGMIIIWKRKLELLSWCEVKSQSTITFVKVCKWYWNMWALNLLHLLFLAYYIYDFFKCLKIVCLINSNSSLWGIESA